MKSSMKLPNNKAKMRCEDRLLFLFPVNKRGAMKIVKEVIIKATKSDTWFWLAEDKSMQKLLNLNSRGKAARSKPALLPSKPGRMDIEPPDRISSYWESLPEIITVLELFEQGKRTRIEVTISGWETVDTETAKSEMPRISLAWEKKLSLLKKAIESAASKHTGP
jgi:hypothetical protein